MMEQALQKILKEKFNKTLDVYKRQDLDAGLGSICNLHQLFLRYDSGYRHQPQGNPCQGILAFLLRALQRGSHVRFAADYAHHAPAGRRCERAAAQPGRYCSRRQPAFLH